MLINKDCSIVVGTLKKNLSLLSSLISKSEINRNEMCGVELDLYSPPLK